MQEQTTSTVQVPAEFGHRALQHARDEVDPDCHLLMTGDTGMVALVLPDRLRGLPETPNLERRLAAIAGRLGVQGQANEAGELLATAARRRLGGSLAARTTRRTEPDTSTRLRPGRTVSVTGPRPVLR